MNTRNTLALISSLANATLSNTAQTDEKEMKLSLDTILLLANGCEPPISVHIVPPAAPNPVDKYDDKYRYDPTTDELCLYINQGKINAIKAYRERTRLGLRESKEAIENAASRLGLKEPRF